MVDLTPKPDPVMLAGSVLAIVGYLLPWFRKDDSYEWSFSGWSYLDLSSGPGWTVGTLVWLALTLAASIWAGRSLAAAMWGVVGTFGAAVFALAVVAASFSNIDERDSINYLAGLPVGAGLYVLGAGLGLLLAGGVRAIVRRVVAAGSD